MRKPTAKTAPPRLLRKPVQRPLGARRLPGTGTPESSQGPTLASALEQFGIRREQPLQLAFDISPVSEWNLTQTSIHPASPLGRCSGYTFECNSGISRLACTWRSPTPWDRLSPIRTAGLKGLFPTFGVSSLGVAGIHLRLRRGPPRRPSEGPIA